MTEDPEKYIEDVDELTTPDDLSILSHKLVELIKQISSLSHAEKCMVILHVKELVGDQLEESIDMITDCIKDNK